MNNKARPDRHTRTPTADSVTFSEAIGASRKPQRRPTFPFERTTRHKPRRWPLAFRFIKGSIHREILVPVTLHAVFACLVVFADQHLNLQLGLPSSIIPSLSIVVGLMLVFRNQTSYSRFWEGRLYLSTVITCVRNLVRCFLTTSYCEDLGASQPPSSRRAAERADTERTVRYLVALLVATKNHLRGEWGGFSGLSSRAPSPTGRRQPGPRLFQDNPGAVPDAAAFLRNRAGARGRSGPRPAAELADLVPPGLVGYEDRGLGVPLQFAALIEQYIKRGTSRGWWTGPTGSQHTAQLNALVEAYGKMETIRLSPVPVALLIHQKQVLALFGAVLPFAMVTQMGWWAIPISALVVFTLYGIDGIATQLEDPFGTDRADIPMDAIVLDIRTELLAMLDEWKRTGALEGEPVDSPLLIDSATTAAGSGDASISASAELRRRGEEGGEWFMPHERINKSLSWGSVRFAGGDEEA